MVRLEIILHFRTRRFARRISRKAALTSVWALEEQEDALEAGLDHVRTEAERHFAVLEERWFDGKAPRTVVFPPKYAASWNGNVPNTFVPPTRRAKVGPGVRWAAASPCISP